MSKSLKRVRRALEAAGLEDGTREMPESTRSAAEAASALGVTVDQIAKSIIFAGSDSGALYLLLTAGGRQVDLVLAQALTGEALVRADASEVRRLTGFAIGGVAPLGHLTPPRAYLDRRLLDFDVVWAAAGTPRHVFPIAPDTLARIASAEIADFSADEKM